VNDQITAGAASIVGSITLATAAGRWYVRPVGRHRAPRRRAAVTVTLDELLGSEPEALVYEQCPREQTQRPHLAHARGERTCTTCGHRTGCVR